MNSMTHDLTIKIVALLDNCLDLDHKCVQTKLAISLSQIRHCAIRSQSSFSDFKELVFVLLQQLTEVELVAMIMWFVWSQRNQVRLKQPTTSLQQIVQLSKDRYSEFLACQVPTMVSAARVRKRWTPPPANLVKINFYEIGRAHV